MKIKIAIINYGLGNIFSVYNAVNYLGYRTTITDEKSDMDNSHVLILPGVGAFGKAMEIIYKKGLREILEDQVIVKKKPILGICLGMQLFATSSEEGGYFSGLNWIEGQVKKLIPSPDYSVPNVGWDELSVLQKTPLFNRVSEFPLFYFDHSYHITCKQEFIAATSDHGTKMIAAVQKGNIFGVQFHPEKSQNNGLKLLRSFFNFIK